MDIILIITRCYYSSLFICACVNELDGLVHGYICNTLYEIAFSASPGM